MKNFAQRIVDCWWEFGNGKISENALKKAPIIATHDNCFICFTLAVNELDEEFTFIDLINFMTKTPYKPKAKKFKYCESPGNPPGCIPKSTPECIAKGGQCITYNKAISKKKTASQLCEENGMIYYNDWKCETSKDVCCVDRTSMMTYMDYLDYDRGVIHMPFDLLPQTYKAYKNRYHLNYDLMDRSVVRKGYKYAISFKDLTKGDLGTFPGASMAIVTGASMGAALGIVAGPVSTLGGAIGGAIIGLVTSVVDSIAEGSKLQGIMITPYPNSKWGNCGFVEET